MALARAVVSGTVASEPEKRFTPNNSAVTNFTITVAPPAGSANRQNAAPFPVKVTCWRGLADAAAQGLKKGDNVLVDGRLIINTFQGQDGVQKRQYEIDATALSQVSGMLNPILPAAAEGGPGNNPNSAPSNGGYAPQNQASAPMQNQAPAGAGYATAPTAPSANQYPQQGPEDFLTEDDIPF